MRVLLQMLDRAPEYAEELAVGLFGTLVAYVGVWLLNGRHHVALEAAFATGATPICLLVLIVRRAIKEVLAARQAARQAFAAEHRKSARRHRSARRNRRS